MLESSLTFLFKQFSANFMFPNLCQAPEPQTCLIWRTVSLREKNAEQKEHVVLELSCGLAPSSLGIWHPECNLFANGSEVAQHYDDAPRTQMHEWTLASCQALEVEVAPVSTRLACRDGKLTSTFSFHYWPGAWCFPRWLQFGCFQWIWPSCLGYTDVSLSSTSPSPSGDISYELVDNGCQFH
jgi:hypothetical protein